jgi:hypothetical protein
VLSLKGPFSLAEVHSWICFCIPDVPERYFPLPYMNSTVSEVILLVLMLMIHVTMVNIH